MTDLVSFALDESPELTRRALSRPVPVISREPCLVWPIPGYVPPNQDDARNKIGYRRSGQAKKLRMRLTMALLSGSARARKVEKGPRMVLVTSFMKRRYDDPNFRQAAKALLDSLQPDHLPNDSGVWCVDHYRQFIANQVGMPIGTLVIVHEIIGWGPERLPVSW